MPIAWRESRSAARSAQAAVASAQAAVVTAVPDFDIAAGEQIRRESENGLRGRAGTIAVIAPRPLEEQGDRTHICDGGERDGMHG